MSDAPTIHAGAVVLGEAGVLIRGPSGAGKSALAAALVERATARGLFGRLVADDRTRLEAHHGRLVAAAPASIAGLIERRGLGVVAAEHAPEVVIRLVVDIEAAPERMPEAEDRSVVVEGVRLPRLAVRRADAQAPGLVLDCLEMERPAASCGANALAFSPRREKMPATAWDAPDVRPDRARVARGGPFPERKDFCAETA